jgi:hypothetical protein
VEIISIGSSDALRCAHLEWFDHGGEVRVDLLGVARGREGGVKVEDRKKRKEKRAEMFRTKTCYIVEVQFGSGAPFGFQIVGTRQLFSIKEKNVIPNPLSPQQPLRPCPPNPDGQTMIQKRRQ